LVLARFSTKLTTMLIRSIYQMIFEFLSEKIPNFKKQNRLKQSPGSEVNILNFTVFKGFPEKAVIFCGKLFLILVFVQDLSQERCFLLENLMALILKNS
jgi:hypothetical protein